MLRKLETKLNEVQDSEDKPDVTDDYKQAQATVGILQDQLQKTTGSAMYKITHLQSSNA